MWVSMNEMADLAKPGDYSIGVFHATNLEQVQGILEAGVEERAPVIIALNEPGAMYAGLGPFLAMTRELVEEVPVPVSVLLDHVHDLDLIFPALEKGYTGVLADPREMKKDDAVDMLLKIKEICEDKGVFFEVELFDLSLAEADKMEYITRIASEIKLDSICLSAGREEREKPGDGLFDLAQKLVESTGLLVSMAGVSRWQFADIRRAVESGAWKISVGTRINKAFTAGLKSYLDSNPDRIHPGSYLGFARDEFRTEVSMCIRDFGVSGMG